MKNDNIKTNGFRLRHLFQPQYGLIWVALLMVAFFAASSDVFRTAGNLLEILRQSGILAIMAIGLTWIVATGEIDVSFADIAAFTGIMTAVLLKAGFSWGLTFIVATFLGTVFGVISGCLVVYFKFPALIATLAVSGIAKSLASLMGKGAVIHITKTGGVVYQLVYGNIFGIPLLFIVTLSIYLICRYMQDRTTAGQHLYALGENRQATQEAGIKEGKILMSLFILSALLASIGGILLTATVSSGNPKIGASYFLDGLTVVFLGAMIIKAGQPNVIGTLIGVIILSILGNGLTLLGEYFFVGNIVKGVLLVFGVVVVTFTRYKKRIDGQFSVA
jgi:ribose/xylose/arabinose/galactoside ABC-type transport system permease subunit